jgi:cyclophilin family peptidyl-prolyl cis-trans isomerase
VTFDSAAPETILSTVSVSGLARGEKLLGIDFRPSNGLLYGVGSKDRLYTIDLASGAATQVGTGSFVPQLEGESLGVDFNPVPDRLRVVSQTDQNLRIHPDTGVVIDANAVKPGVQLDGELDYAAGDVRARANARVVGVAYTNNFAGALSTTLYGIDANKDALVIVGSPGGAPVSPNTGQLTTVGPLGVNTTRFVGFDIGTDGVALASLRAPGDRPAKLYTIDLATGAASLVGTIGTSRTLRDLSVLPAAPLPSVSVVDLSVTESNTQVLMEVRLSGPTTVPVTVELATADNTATAGADYDALNLVLQFNPGETIIIVGLNIRDDLLREPTETLLVNLSNPMGLTIADGQAVVAIVDNELNPVVTFTTTLGVFQIELAADAAPITVANFLAYVNRGDYDGTFFHRLVPNFVLQGGGYDSAAAPLPPLPPHIPTDPPIPSEIGLPNLRGTIAMARTPLDLNSATSEWFINLVDNPALDSPVDGFTVFGRVLGSGMQVVDMLGAVPTFDLGVPLLQSIPLQNYVIGNPAEVQNLLVVDQITVQAAPPPPAAPLLQYRLEATDLMGVPIDSATVGQTFKLNVLVSDLRPAGTNDGVFAGYVDVSYNAGLLSADPLSLTNGPDYPLLPAGNVPVQGLINDAGGADGAMPLGPAERLLWSIELTATAAGTTTLFSDPADEANHETLLFGLGTAIDPTLILYGSLTFTILI